MGQQTNASDPQNTVVVVRRVDVLLTLMIIVLMIVLYHWVVAHRQLQYERQVNAEFVKTKAELAEALAVEKVNLNRRIGLVEQIVVDKKFIENWGGFIKEIDQYRGEKSRNASNAKTERSAKSAKGSQPDQLEYVKADY